METKKYYITKISQTELLFIVYPDNPTKAILADGQTLSINNLESFESITKQKAQKQIEKEIDNLKSAIEEIQIRINDLEELINYFLNEISDKEDELTKLEKTKDKFTDYQFKLKKRSILHQKRNNFKKLQEAEQAKKTKEKSKNNFLKIYTKTREFFNLEFS